MLRSQARQRRFELQRLVDRSMDELLDDRLAPRAERALAESSAETLDAGNTNPADFHGVAVEDDHAGVDENLPHLILFPGFEIVIPKDGCNGNTNGCDLARENSSFVRQSVVGEIASEQQHVGALGDSREQRLKGA